MTPSSPSFWGVDISTKAVDVAMIDSDGHTALTCHVSLPGARFKGAQSLNDTMVLFGDWLNFLPETHPTLVVVESPFVRAGGQSLMMTYGVVLAVLAGHVRCPIVEVASSTWKKGSVGHGHATKDDVAQHAKAALGWAGSRQDHADALCMAMHAKEIWALAVAHRDV